MVHKISGSYDAYISVFFLFVVQVINKPLIGVLFGLNKSYLIVSVLVTFFGLYAIAALKTAKAGRRESEALMEKYTSS